ncbi:MAG: hypothetical protein HQK83_06970 [Fibrobacteria bacterium]|nr:hypothetical protein [Fibrobacteria bacterium]
MSQTGLKWKLMILCIFLLDVVAFGADAIAQKVIFETDMESDIDDAGALAMLHAMADNGECEIIAVMHNTSDPYGPGVIDAINTWYYRPDIPIGKYPIDDAYSVTFGGESRYTEAVSKDSTFPKDIFTRDDVPDAVEVYKQMLPDQPDSSIIIISVGWQMNLRRLHEDSLGRVLIEKKVKQLVIMGGRWNPSGKPHMNLAGRSNEVPVAAKAGEYVVNKWPTPVLYLGIGAIPGFAGSDLEQEPYENPVRRCYEYAIEHSRFNLNWEHHTADQSTILLALRGVGEYWTLIDEGIPTMYWDGSAWMTKWDSSPDSHHTAVTKVSDKAKLAEATDIIEALMVQAPKQPVMVRFDHIEPVSHTPVRFNSGMFQFFSSSEDRWYDLQGKLRIKPVREFP